MYLIFDSNISIEDIPKEENLFASGEWTLDSQNIHQKNLKLFSDADYSSLLSDSEIKYLDEIYDQYGDLFDEFEAQNVKLNKHFDAQNVALNNI